MRFVGCLGEGWISKRTWSDHRGVVESKQAYKAVALSRVSGRGSRLGNRFVVGMRARKGRWGGEDVASSGGFGSGRPLGKPIRRAKVAEKSRSSAASGIGTLVQGTRYRCRKGARTMRLFGCWMRDKRSVRGSLVRMKSCSIGHLERCGIVRRNSLDRVRKDRRSRLRRVGCKNQGRCKRTQSGNLDLVGKWANRGLVGERSKRRLFGLDRAAYKGIVQRKDP